jgi:MFS family permease
MYNNEATIPQDVSHSLVNKKHLFLASVICMLAAMFYMYEYTLQVSPAVMTNELMRDLGLNAASLGTMTAFYFYSYTPMQLPAGLLFDRFGPRRLITLAILICAIGAFFFGTTPNAVMASLGRLLMGIGSSFSFIGALLLVSRWFPLQYFALLTGLVQLMSSVGAIVGQVPLVTAINHWGWRSTTIALATVGCLLALLVWVIVRDSPEAVSKGRKFQSPPKKSELKRLQQVCSNRQTWLTALYSFSIWAPITAFAALWGIPFLVASYNLTTKIASEASAMIWLGIGIGSPLAGWLSDKFNSRSKPLSLCAMLGIVSLTIIIYCPFLPLSGLYLALFVFGLAASGQSLAFGVVKDNNTACVVGTAIGFNNMAVVAGGALFQPLIGVLLYLNGGDLMRHGTPIYSTVDYQKALFVLPLCYMIAFFVSHFLLRETYCKPQYSNEAARTI